MSEAAEQVMTAGDVAAERVGGGLPVVRLGALAFHRVDEAGAVREIVASAQAGVGGWVVTPNVEILRLCTVDASVRELVRQATLTLADGMPLIWASRLQGTPLPERVCGSNMIWSVSGAAAEAGLSVFLLGGGTERTAEKAAAALRERYPELKIVGTYYPPFGFERDEEEIARIAGAVARARPDIVYVGLSVPKTERLIERIRPVQPRAWWIGVGVSLSFVCGEVVRAPRWMQRWGLEWAHRLVQEPGRLMKRYLLHNIPFAGRLLATAAWRRFRGSAGSGAGAGREA